MNNMNKTLFICVIFCGAFTLTSAGSLAGGRDGKAYFGTPSIIPHGVEEEGRSACLHCHENGLVVDNIKTPVTPHPELVNCRQCHLRLQTTTVFRPNSFAGLPVPERSYRSNPYAPPLIPHRVFMLERCLVCHDDKGLSGTIVQTGHPEREDCSQCHLALIDREIFGGPHRTGVVKYSDE